MPTYTHTHTHIQAHTRVSGAWQTLKAAHDYGHLTDRTRPQQSRRVQCAKRKFKFELIMMPDSARFRPSSICAGGHQWTLPAPTTGCN